MNYRYQLYKVDYSHGLNNAVYDHDDWSAVLVGMNDFINSPFEPDDNQARRRGGPSMSQTNQLSQQEMIDAIQH